MIFGLNGAAAPALKAKSHDAAMAAVGLKVLTDAGYREQLKAEFDK